LLTLRMVSTTPSPCHPLFYGTNYCVRTQASCTYVYVTGGSINNCFYTPNIGFESPVRTSVGMRNAYTKGYALSADITLCHLSAPP